MNSKSTEIPHGWRVVSLGEVCDVQLGKMLSPKSKQGTRPIPYLRNANVQWGRFELGDVSEMDFSEHEESKFLLRRGDLLVCEGGEPGRAAIWNGEIERCCYQKALHRIRPLNEAIDPHFVMFRLWLGAFAGEFTDQNAKTTIAHLPEVRLVKLPLALPSLNEQQRITARLREQLAEVERARAAVAAQLQAAETLPAAFLRAVFSTPAAQQWPRRPFGELVKNFDGVRVPLKQSDRAKRQGKFPYYGASGIIDQIDGFLFDGDFLLIAEDGANLVARSTPIAFKASGKFWVNNHAHVVQPKLGVLLDYLKHFFAVADIGTFITGSAQPKLSQGILNGIPVPVPSPEEQQTICEQLAAELSSTMALREYLSQKLVALEKIPAALLRKAFSGRI